MTDKWIISWDIGDGFTSHVVIEAKSEHSARAAAYEAAREEFENNVIYQAVPYTEEAAEKLGV